MEEKILNIGEQPEFKNSTLDAEEQQKNLELENGSPISKFKSAKELGMAYQNLEKEFTQKCQKIKELTDKIDALENTSFVPEYQRDDWEKNVKTFVENHPMAKEYLAEISEVLQTDKSVANQTGSLDVALTKVLANKFVPYSELVKDETFLEKYVFSNKDITEKVINSYLESLQKNQAMPLMTSISGSGTFTSPVKKPKTIKDAGKMVEAYFKN